MSLLSYLEGTEHQPLRNKFKTEFERPAFTCQNRIIAPPVTTNYAIIGAAFDYLLRFYIQFHNKTQINSRSWVASHGLNSIKKRLKTNPIICKALDTKFDTCKKRFQLYLTNGRMTTSLIADTLFLAKLDLTARTGVIAPDLQFESPKDILDLRQLYKNINATVFRNINIGHMNPGFMHGSTLVGGADADLIINDILIEIKCTKELKLNRSYLNQVIGYYILSLLHNSQMPRKKRYNINHLGIYFARHGVLFTFPVTHLGSKKKVKLFKEWFCDYITNCQKSYS